MNVAILKCLIEESGKLDEGTVMLMVGENTVDRLFHAEVTYGDGATLHDPIGHEVWLHATGRSPAEAISNLEILLQRWY